MRRIETRCRSAALLLALMVSRVGSVASLGAEETALDRYVKQPDPTYAWKVVNKADQTNPSQTFVVHLTSQTWRSAQEVNRTKWEHWVSVFAEGHDGCSRTP